MAARSRFGTRRSGAQAQVQGRWSLTASLFGEVASRPLLPRPSGRRPAAGSPAAPLPSPERRALAELLLERYGIVTREQVLAEGIRGGFALLYDAFSQLETLGVCRRGYFIEGHGRRAVRAARRGRAAARRDETVPGGASRRSPSVRVRTLVLAAADPAQPYGAALPWPKRAGQDRRPARVAGAYVVLVADLPVLYVERGGRGLVTLTEAPLRWAAPHAAPVLARSPPCEAVRARRVGKLALERIDGEPAIASELAGTLVELGFHPGPRKLTLSA